MLRFSQSHSRYRLASGRGWSAATHQTRRDLVDRLLDLRSAVVEAYSLLASVSYPAVEQPVSPWLILDELRTLQQGSSAEGGGLQFGDGQFTDAQVDLRNRLISVTTEPIELEGIQLGRFQITLSLRRMLSGTVDVSAFSVEALDPNPADGDESIVHPHVRDSTPCLGDATVPIVTALRQGRIGDAFSLVERVLQTYNVSSPYRRLDEWSHVSCDSCGDSVPPEESIRCRSCEDLLCGGCSIRCDGCDRPFCGSCISSTSDGDSHVCRSCRGTCGNCGSIELQSTLDEQDGLCHSCHQERDAEEREPEDEADSSADDADTAFGT